MIDLAAVLLQAPRPLDPAALVEAGARFGLTLTPKGTDGVISLDLPEGDVHLVLIEAAHPGAAEPAYGPLAIEAEVTRATTAHVLVTGRELPGEVRERDATMLRLVAATLQATGGVSASLAPGVIFHRPGLVLDFAALVAEEGELPFEVAVDITSARESEDRMSFLTHGLERHGSEDLYVTASVNGRGALDFLLGVGRWFHQQPEMRLPTGDTLGRSETERVTIQRVPSPIDPSRTVVRLDLDL
ncbi:MAG: hypothetical protein H6721_21000 [Sandaracinus sp.]|nr:hypothetical protein [Sandaracinus sp.]MCB9634611.1 hypothetical protein [Sandaracinus sp.]